MAGRSLRPIHALLLALTMGLLGFLWGRGTRSESGVAPDAREHVVPAGAAAASSELSEPGLHAAREPGVASGAAAPVQGIEASALRGTVRDEQGRPVADALLLLGQDALYPLADARPIGRSGEGGALLASGLVPITERHIVHHLFALGAGGIGWTKLHVDEEAPLLAAGEIRFVHSANVLVTVMDESLRPLAGVSVQARARFYPFAGLFDADEPGFAPDPAVLKFFTATTDGLGHARFEHLPAPHSAGFYEMRVDLGDQGSGFGDLEQSGAEPEAEVRVVVRPKR